MAFRLSLKAEDDLVDIYLTGVRTFGQVKADRYYLDLQDTCDFLSRFPQAARERTEIEPPVRIHPHKAHVIVYVVLNDDVLILRIRHGSEDWSDRLA